MDKKNKALRVDLNSELSKDLVDIKNYHGIQSDSDMIRYLIRNHKKELLSEKDYSYFTQENTDRLKILQENGSYEEVHVNDLDLKSSEFDLELIRYNLSPWCLSYILKGIFSKIPIVLIYRHEYVIKHLMNFFDYITENSFKLNMSFITQENYNKNSEDYKEYIVLKSKEIINDNKNVLIKKKLKIEKEIAQNFFSEDDSKFSLINLKNDVRKAFILSNKMKPIISRADKISTKEIEENLKKNFPFEITRNYLDFLIGILTNYFNVNEPKIYNAIAELL